MNKFLILMYHMISEPVSAEQAQLACSPRLFRTQLTLLKSQGYSFYHLSDVIEWLKKNQPIPERSIVITMDDGYQDNYENAFPILNELKVPATIFLATALIGETNRWINNETFANKAMLSWQQIEEMRTHGIRFGGHTKNHVRLTEVDDKTALDEITQCKSAIENRLGEKINYFAYPYGLFKQEHKEMVKEAGFTASCSTQSGFNGLDADILALRRIDVHGSDNESRFMRKISFGTNDGSIMTTLGYYAKKALGR